MITPELIQTNSKKLISNQNYPAKSVDIENESNNSNNKIIEVTNEINPNHNSSDNINQKEGKNSKSNSKGDSFVNNRDNISNELSKNETLMSYDEKDGDNLEILVKEIMIIY